jgi:hypothetical protein
MKYISKGMVIRASTEDLLFVTRCGVDFQLTGEQAALWLNGRFGFAKNRENVPEIKALQQLKRQGLIEITEGDEPVFEYRALTQCILPPATSVSSVKVTFSLTPASSSAIFFASARRMKW